MSDATLTGNRLLYIDPRPIRQDQHGALGLMRSTAPYGFAAQTHLVPVTIGEIADVSAHYPMVFMGEDCVPATALGLQADRNPFVAPSGAWQAGNYVPAYLRQYPFAMAASSESEGVLCVDTACDRLSADSPDEPFFSGNEPSAFLQRAMTLCKQVEADRQRTEAMVREIKAMGLFTSITLRFPKIGPEEEPLSFEITGIDHERLAGLEQGEKARLIDNGSIALIVGWQFSQRHWPKIARFSLEDQGEMS